MKQNHFSENILEINNLKKTYKSKEIVEVLKGVSLNIERNSVIGLIGDNGAGKTTLIKCICGLVEPSEGEIIFDGVDTARNEAYIRNNVGVLLEGARNLYNFLSVDYNLNYFGYLNNLEQKEIDGRKERLLKEFELEKYRNQPVNELSRGTQQKVAMMVTLMKNPELLILDEPTLGLDLISTIRMIELLKRIINTEGKTVIIISHDMTLITSLCKRTIYLKNGKVEFDEKIESIINTNYFQVKIQCNDNTSRIFIENKISYVLEEGIATVETCELERVLNLFSADDVISIEKQLNTLEMYIKERLESNL